MLSIGKLTAEAGSARYYEESVAPERHDYYSGRGESEGVWTGSGAEALGLRGVVEKGQLEELLSGANPATGDPLRATEAMVQGFDLTFSAPKSVSVLYAVADEAARAAVVDGHERAVRDALGYLEREAVQVRRGKRGAIREHAGGLVAGAYRHRTSRAGDPQLHTHVVAANMAQGIDGRWTALHAAPLYTHAKTAGYLYQAALREHLTRDLGVEWTAVHKGAAEIVGLPPEVLEHFSQRRAEIREAMAHAGTTSSRAAEVAALDTRRAKEHGVEGATIYERWQARAAEHGFTRDALDGILGRELEPEVGQEELRRAAELMAGERGLTLEASTFSRREALQAWAGEHRHGADVARLELLTDRWLASDLVVRVEGDERPLTRGQVIATHRGTRVADVEARYSTPDMLATEQQLMARATERLGEGAGVAVAGHVDAALAARSYLAGEQAEMVRALTRSGDGVQVVLAKAGAGKTTALDAAREAWQRSRLVVQGTALGSFATKELRDSGIDACTVARLMLDIQRHGLPRGSVLIVDEAGMVGTRQLAILARYAEEARAKLVLVGDDKQLPEIDAGGAFRGLADRLGAIELQENRRQQDPADREALDAHRDGRTDELVESLRRRGRVAVAANHEETRVGLVADWWEGARAEGLERVAMIALRRSEVRELNALARDRMRAEGRLSGCEVVLDSGRAFAVGDRVVTRQNAPKLGVVNGSRGKLVAIADDGAMRVRLDDGGEVVDLPADYTTARRGDQPFVEHGYAITANGIQGGTTHRAYVLGSEEAYREWAYVAFSRHRHEMRFYVTAPDAPEHEQLVLGAPAPDPLASIARALGESRAKSLAIDAGHDKALRELPDDRLRREAAHLRSLLETAPPPAIRGEIDLLARQRDEALDALRRAATSRDEAKALLDGARRRDRPPLRDRLAAEDRTIAMWQGKADALDGERRRLLEVHGDPDTWVANRRPELLRLAAVEQEMARRDGVRQADALRRVVVDPPTYVTDELGQRPEEPTARRAWDRGARAIESYRQRYGASIDPAQPGLGERPADRHARIAHQAAARHVARARDTLDLPRTPTHEVNVDLGPDL